MGKKNLLVRSVFDAHPHVIVRPFNNGSTEIKEPFSIQGISHTVPRHVAWMVSTERGKVLHIADPKLNRENSIREVDSVWVERFAGLAPDILFINAGGNSVRREKEDRRYLVESGALSPVEAAQIVAVIQPRVVSLIGCYNHSVWRNREEDIPQHLK